MLRTQLFSTSDESAWESILPAQRSAFGCLAFARLAEKHHGFTSRLFVVSTDEGEVAYPFFERPLDSLPFTPLAGMWDTATPEFTGPFGLTPQNAKQFLDQKNSTFREIGAVSEFIHLHPFAVDPQLLEGDGGSFNRELIWVDIGLSNEELYEKHFSHACRKNIRRAQAESVQVVPASGREDIREFHRIYCQTMDRNQALSSYYFPVEYFFYIFENLTESSRFALAERKGNIIGAILYLHDQDNVYSYLGGADYAFQNLRPSNAIVYDTICWARSAGKKRLILGAGYRPDDGIFRFKASFSQSRVAFHTYRYIHQPELYQQLTAAWSLHASGGTPPKGYFPAYRAACPAREASEKVCLAL